MECSTHIVVDFNVACQERKKAQKKLLDDGGKVRKMHNVCIHFPQSTPQSPALDCFFYLNFETKAKKSSCLFFWRKWATRGHFFSADFFNISLPHAINYAVKHHTTR